MCPLRLNMDELGFVLILSLSNYAVPQIPQVAFTETQHKSTRSNLWLDAIHQTTVKLPPRWKKNKNQNKQIILLFLNI